MLGWCERTGDKTPSYSIVVMNGKIKCKIEKYSLFRSNILTLMPFVCKLNIGIVEGVFA